MNQLHKLRFGLNLAAMLALACLLSGCISPHTSPRAPEIRGRVMDAKTHLPIKGAKVCFIEPPYHTTYTDADGYFWMKEANNFHWFAGADSSGYPPPKSNGIRITHKNYAFDELWPGYDDPQKIFLQPTQ